MKLSLFLLPTLAVAFDNDGTFQHVGRMLDDYPCESQRTALSACEAANDEACVGDDFSGTICMPDGKYIIFLDTRLPLLSCPLLSSLITCL
jgi:hypothetical protein